MVCLRAVLPGNVEITVSDGAREEEEGRAVVMDPLLLRGREGGAPLLAVPCEQVLVLLFKLLFFKTQSVWFDVKALPLNYVKTLICFIERLTCRPPLQRTWQENTLRMRRRMDSDDDGETRDH